ncbi:MAG: hypothetical protein Edafosvirus40_9, partial [Edafosvirus sp.]
LLRYGFANGIIQKGWRKAFTKGGYRVGFEPFTKPVLYCDKNNQQYIFFKHGNTIFRQGDYSKANLPFWHSGNNEKNIMRTCYNVSHYRLTGFNFKSCENCTCPNKSEKIPI